MHSDSILDALHLALAAHLPSLELDRNQLEWVKPFGVAHDFARVRSGKLFLRIPLLSQTGMSPDDNLVCQVASFERCAPCQHVPRLLGVIPPTPLFKMGVFVVEEISGRSPLLPIEMGKLSKSIASLHLLPLLQAEARSPIASMHPIKDTVSLIVDRAVFLEKAGLSSDAKKMVQEEIDWARNIARDAECETLSLCAVDCHPGNFVVDSVGKAWLVDVEKVAYTTPAADLAHASLAISTMLDPRCAALLTTNEITQFYDSYRTIVGEQRWQAIARWCVPFRRLIWIRVLSWMAKWKVEEETRRVAGLDHFRRNREFAIHTAERIVYTLSAEGIEFQRRDWSGANALVLS